MRFVLKLGIGLCLFLGLVACGKDAAPSPNAGPQATTLTAQAVYDAFVNAGLEVFNPHAPLAREAAMNPPAETFSDNLGFNVKEAGARGGQIYICKTRESCDLVADFYQKAKEPRCPDGDCFNKYRYRSADGRVLVLLFREITPETAAKFQKVVETFASK